MEWLMGLMFLAVPMLGVAFLLNERRLAIKNLKEIENKVVQKSVYNVLVALGRTTNVQQLGEVMKAVEVSLSGRRDPNLQTVGYLIGEVNRKLIQVSDEDGEVLLPHNEGR